MSDPKLALEDGVPKLQPTEDLGQDERDAPLVRQPGHEFGGGVQTGVVDRRPRQRLGRDAGVEPPGANRGTDVIRTGPPRDRQQPRADRGPTLEVGKRAKRTQIGVLRDVVGVLDPDQGGHEPPHFDLGGPHERSRRGIVTASRAKRSRGRGIVAKVGGHGSRAYRPGLTSLTQARPSRSIRCWTYRFHITRGV